MFTFGVIVLAAGKSSRMGRSKQLLKINGQTLVQHAAVVSMASGAKEVIVVLGAEAEDVQSSLTGLNIKKVINTNWAEGMGSSISAGLANLSDEVETVVIVLCDQPLITSKHVRELASHADPVAASIYNGVVGAPCAFARSQFSELLALSEDKGARDLIRNPNTFTIAFQGGSIDVDTLEDYERLLATLNPLGE